jgi:hypothetical protein
MRSSACINCVRLLRLRSLTMGGNGNSGDAVTQTSTGYFLKQMFMFISCIIMNIVMFNSDLNIHTCTWIVSLTTLLKCLLNYKIKICQNVVYHLTHQRWTDQLFRLQNKVVRDDCNLQFLVCLDAEVTSCKAQDIYFVKPKPHVPNTTM